MELCPTPLASGLKSAERCKLGEDNGEQNTDSEQWVFNHFVYIRSWKVKVMRND